MNVLNAEKTGENLKKLMDSNGITVKRMAKEIGVGQQSVYKWLHGTSLPNIDNLIILADILKTSLDELLIKDVI